MSKVSCIVLRFEYNRKKTRRYMSNEAAPGSSERGLAGVGPGLHFQPQFGLGQGSDHYQGAGGVVEVLQVFGADGAEGVHVFLVGDVDSDFHDLIQRSS